MLSIILAEERAPLRHLQWHGDHKLGHAHEVPGGHDVLALSVSALDAAIAALAEPARGLGPAEDFLDTLAQLLADGVREGEQHVQRLRAIFAGAVQYDLFPAQSLDELMDAVALAHASISVPSTEK